MDKVVTYVMGVAEKHKVLVYFAKIKKMRLKKEEGNSFLWGFLLKELQNCQQGEHETGCAFITKLLKGTNQT